MACGDVCEADRTLPDGNTNYNIDNCGSYDVFEKVCGGQGTPTPQPTSTNPPGQSATFVPVTNCPSNPDLPECTAQMACGDLCEADRVLPDGNTDYNIDNCGGYDVFEKVCNGQGTPQPISTNPPGQGATFAPVSNCPPSPANLPECTAQMACGDVCEADRTLPDGNTNYNIDNCGSYDVFEKVCGQATPQPVTTRPPSQGATFSPVTNCPSNADLPECTAQTACGELCEADRTLPDGNTNYDINNCGGYDVFEKVCGGQGTPQPVTPPPAQGATYTPVAQADCPANRDLPECTAQTACGAMCEADQPLPDGNMNYDINNCGGYDVFLKSCGSQTPAPVSTSPPTSGNGKDCPRTGNYLDWCEPCMFSGQCPQGGYCCPYMKKCVSSSSHGCFTPIADCVPPYHESSQNYPEGRQCGNSNFPNNWMDYDDCMRKSGKAPRLLRL